MKLLRTTALTAALMTAAVMSITSPAQAQALAGWGWSWPRLVAAGTGNPYATAYGYAPYGYGYWTGYNSPAYAYGYGTGYGYPASRYYSSVTPLPDAMLPYWPTLLVTGSKSKVSSQLF